MDSSLYNVLALFVRNQSCARIFIELSSEDLAATNVSIKTVHDCALTIN